MRMLGSIGGWMPASFHPVLFGSRFCDRQISAGKSELKLTKISLQSNRRKLSDGGGSQDKKALILANDLSLRRN